MPHKKLLRDVMDDFFKEKELSRLFGRFAGREVVMEEKKITAFGATHRFYKPNKPKSPVLKQMQKIAQREGYILRLHFPGRIVTKDLRFDRVNARIEKSADGKWRIGNKFTLG